jgi:hypothetical protein
MAVNQCLVGVKSSSVKMITSSNRVRAPQMCKNMNTAVSLLNNFVQSHKDKAPNKVLVKAWCAHELVCMNYDPSIRKGLKQILKHTPWDNVMIPSNTEADKLVSEYASIL